MQSKLRRVRATGVSPSVRLVLLHPLAWSARNHGEIMNPQFATRTQRVTCTPKEQENTIIKTGIVKKKQREHFWLGFHPSKEFLLTEPHFAKNWNLLVFYFCFIDYLQKGIGDDWAVTKTRNGMDCSIPFFSRFDLGIVTRYPNLKLVS